MAVGSVAAGMRGNSFARGLYRLFGTPDFHSHLRLKPLFEFMKKQSGKPLDVLELGCGTGGVLMETYRRSSVRKAVGVDIDRESIARANSLRIKAFPTANITFVAADAAEFSLGERFDVILLMDVLEHVEDTASVLAVVREHIRPDGLILISVPTPMFPKVFGRDFHELIGHVRDGYSAQDLEQIFQEFVFLERAYSTGPLVFPFCALYYRLIRRIPWGVGRDFAGFALLPATWLDVWRPGSRSCSLFAAFRAV